MVIAEPFRPGRPQRRQALAQPPAHLELGAVALAVVEADGLDAGETFERPREADGRILAAREQHQGGVARGQGHAITEPSGHASVAISAISASLSAKSKIAAFSDSRSSLLVRG